MQLMDLKSSKMTPRRLTKKLLKLSDVELGKFIRELNGSQMDFCKEKLCEYYAKLFDKIDNSNNEKDTKMYSNRRDRMIPLLGAFA